MPQFDPSSFASQVFWLAVTFIALYVVMARVVVPRISEVLETRRRRIETNLEKAEALKKDAATALAAYEKAVGEARAQARGLIAEAGQRIAEAGQRQEAELAKKLAAQVADGEAGIARALDAAMAGVRDAAAEAAAEAQELLARYQRQQREVAGEAESIVRHARDETKRMTEEGQAKLEAALKRREAAARERIRRAEEQAMAVVRARAIDLAIAATRQLLAQRLTPAKDDALIDRAIKELPARLH